VDSVARGHGSLLGACLAYTVLVSLLARVVCMHTTTLVRSSLHIYIPCMHPPEYHQPTPELCIHTTSYSS
jgi:hypothetical protein